MTGEEFKMAREGLGLTQKKLADLWGMGEHGDRTVRRWEKGDIPISARDCRLMLYEMGKLRGEKVKLDEI